MLAVIALGWLACAPSDAQSGLDSAELRVQIPEARRAQNPAPEEAITVASLSGGGILHPGVEGSAGAGESVVLGVVPEEKAPSIPIAKASPELPAEVLSYLSGGLSDGLGSLDLSPSGDAPGGMPISLTSDMSLLGEEFDLRTPSLAPPAAPALD